jgi:hypothetical protein
MTYDDTVLTAAQTQEITAIFEELEEVLVANIETVEFEPIEEITFVPFEEPEIVMEMFSEIYVEEAAVEEISVGVVNVFTLAPPEEIIEMSSLPAIETFKEIPMEVSYGSQENFQEVPTEIESFEEIIEVRESPNIEAAAEAIQGGEESPVEELGGRNEFESTENEGAVPQRAGGEMEPEPTEQIANESETSPEPTEEETLVASEEVNNEPRGASEENEVNGEGETSTSGNGNDGDETTAGAEENIESGNQEVEESRDEGVSPRDNQIITVENIQQKVAEVIKEVDKQLVATSVIVAKAMQSSFSMDNYGKVNKDILNQPNIDGGDYFETRQYIDVRNLYAENQNVYGDPVAQYQKNVQDKVDERIRAEEHLRRIRGY